MLRHLTFRCALALAGLSAVPAAAHAHTALKSSEPAKGSRLSESPSRIALWFTARPQLGFSKLTLTGPSGEVLLGPLASDSGNALVAPITRGLAAGEYVVRWQTASADGHPIRGEFAFTVLGAAGADASADSVPATSTLTDSAAAMQVHEHTPRAEAHVTHGEYRVVRWIEFVALLTMLGVLGFRAFVLPPLASRGVPTDDAADRARRLGQSAVFLYVLSAVVRLYTESVAIHGETAALDRGELLPMITTTTWGLGWMLGLGGALLVYAGWKLSKRFEFGRPIALLGVLALVFSPGLSGHAASVSPAPVGIVIDALHVSAAGLWIGGLLIVLIAGVPALRRLAPDARDPAVASLVNSFHPLALLCAPLVLLTGLGATWMRLNATSQLWTTAFGITLLWKILLFFVVATLGAYHSIRGRRRLGTELATRNVRLSIAVELLFAALVIAATTILVVTPIPAELVVQ